MQDLKCKYSEVENSFLLGGMLSAMKMRGTGKGNGVKRGNTFNAGVGSVVVSGAGRVVVTEIYLVFVLKEFIIQ